jgi:phosphoglycolate phosphatase-like HAD superfamily hydrolase
MKSKNNSNTVIVFDFDGVIVDSVSLMYQLTKGSYKDMTDEDVREVFSGKLYENLESNKWTKIEETEDEYKHRVLLYQQEKMKLPLYDGMYEILNNLSQLARLTINTHAKISNCLPILEKNKASHLFSYIASKEAGASKTEKFFIIAKQLNIEITSMIFVTDTTGDIIESAEANIPTIAVTWGISNKQEFIKQSLPNMIAIVETPQELLEALKKKIL